MLERCAGIVFGFLIKGPEVTRVTDETLGRHLPQGHDWLWLHLSLADHRARRFLETWDDLPEDARELMLGSEDRIQLHLTPGGGWGVLPDIERDFADQSLGSGRFFFWREGSRLVTARRHSLRAIEMKADVILKGTRVDGIYTADPEKDATATKYETISFEECIQKNLKVMDMTAFTLCMENKLPIIVFDMNSPGNLLNVVSGSNVGTLVN